MNKKTTVITIIVIAIIALGAISGLMWRTAGTLPPFEHPPAGMTLYYGNGCPHCEKVDEFLKMSDLEAKIQLEKKEVAQNPVNAAELQARAQTCEITDTAIGVPFLFVDNTSTCYLGDQAIIEYFQMNYGPKNQDTATIPD